MSKTDNNPFGLEFPTDFGIPLPSSAADMHSAKQRQEQHEKRVEDARNRVQTSLYKIVGVLSGLPGSTSSSQTAVAALYGIGVGIALCGQDMHSAKVAKDLLGIDAGADFIINSVNEEILGIVSKYLEAEGAANA